LCYTLIYRQSQVKIKMGDLNLSKESTKFLGKDSTNLKSKHYQYETSKPGSCTFKRLIFTFGLLAVMVVIFMIPDHKVRHSQHALKHWVPTEILETDIVNTQKEAEDTFVDTWWQNRDFKKVGNYISEIKKYCETIVEGDKEEFGYYGSQSEEVPNNIVFSTHHKTGTHLLRNIVNLLFRAANMKPKRVGFCGSVPMEQGPGKEWAQHRLHMWCSRGGSFLREGKAGQSFRMAQLMRQPENMLVSQHLYQTALAHSRSSYTDQVDRKTSLFYIGLKKHDPQMMWMGTFDRMLPVIEDMLDQMNQTLGNRDVITVDMELDFFADFDGTVKQILDHILQDRVTPLQRCILRIEASFQDTKRFGGEVDHSHGNTHVAANEAKEKAKGELESLLSSNDEGTQMYRDKFSSWAERYKEYSKTLMRHRQLV